MIVLVIQKTQQSYIFTVYSLLFTLYLYLYLYLYNFFLLFWWYKRRSGATSLLFTLYLYLYLYLYNFFLIVWLFKISLSLSNFFDSENIGLRHSLSLSKKFDRDNERLYSILQHIFYTVLMSNFLARWQYGKKTTYDQK